MLSLVDRFQLPVVLVLALAASSSGCNPIGALETRFANEFQCGRRVHATPLGAGTYAVQGCGIRATYTCVLDGHTSRTTCVIQTVQRGGRVPAPPTATADTAAAPTLRPSPTATTATRSPSSPRTSLLDGEVGGQPAVRFELADEAFTATLQYVPARVAGLVRGRVADPDGETRSDCTALRVAYRERPGAASMLMTPVEGQPGLFEIPTDAVEGLARDDGALELRVCDRVTALSAEETLTLTRFLLRVREVAPSSGQPEL